MTDADGPLVLALVDDLLFLSRIQEAGRAAGVSVQAVRSADAVAQGTPGAVAVMVDLDAGRLPVDDVLSALRADARTANLPIIGFFSHVHAERGRAAQAAGYSRVLPRGAFVQELSKVMAELRRGG